MNPLVRLYGESVRAGVSIGMATGVVVGALVVALYSPGLAPFGAFYGLIIGGVGAIVPSALGGLVVVAVVRRKPADVRRDLAITFAAIIGVLDAVTILLDPTGALFVAVVNVVMAPMLWWAWRSLSRTAEAAV